MDRFAEWCFSRGNGVFLVGYVVCLIAALALGALWVKWKVRR